MERQNPPPIPPPTGEITAPVPTPAANPLYYIARGQRCAIYTIPGSLLCIFISWCFTGVTDNIDGSTAFALFIVVGPVVAVVFFRIWTVYKSAWALGIQGAPLIAGVSIIDCIGLLIIFTLNKRATERLRQAGVRVGFLGVRRQDMERLVATPPANAL